MQFTYPNLMSVWSFQGGMEIVTECRAEGHCFIDKNLPPKKASQLPSSPNSEQNQNWKPDPSHLAQYILSLTPSRLHFSPFYVCKCPHRGGGRMMTVEAVSRDSTPSSAPDRLVLNLTKHGGCLSICEMGKGMQRCLWVALLWDQRRG